MMAVAVDMKELVDFVGREEPHLMEGSRDAGGNSSRGL